MVEDGYSVRERGGWKFSEMMEDGDSVRERGGWKFRILIIMVSWNFHN